MHPRVGWDGAHWPAGRNNLQSAMRASTDATCLQPRQRESISSPDTALDLVQQGRALAACLAPISILISVPIRVGIVSWMRVTTEMGQLKKVEVMMMMMARSERQGTGDRGDDLSLDHPNTHTLDAVFLSPSAKQGKGWTERPGSCVFASPRLVSFLLDLGKLPKLDLGVLANDEDPGSSLCWTICATFEIHTVELEDNHSRSLHRTIIAHPHQPTSHFTPPVGVSRSVCSYDSRAFHSITTPLLSGLPTGTESLSERTTRPDWPALENSRQPILTGLTVSLATSPCWARYSKVSGRAHAVLPLARSAG